MDKISVIIVTFNNKHTIKKCLDSILKYDPEVDTVIFDNNSEDKTIQIVEQFSKVTLIKSPENLGFGKACNQAAQTATGEILIFLNPDTEILEKGDLEKLALMLIRNPGYGLIGPKLILESGSTQKSVRNLPTVWGAVREYLFGVKNSFEFFTPECQELCEVEYVVGACMVIKRSTLEKIGGFNEKYFLYFEDVQFCQDIRNNGLKIGFTPEVEIKHLLGASGKGQLTNKLSRQSGKKYHGVLNFLLIEYIGRMGHKLHGKS